MHKPKKNIDNRSIQAQLSSSQLNKELALTKLIFQTMSLGILVVDKNQENVLLYNESFVESWELPLNILEQGSAVEVFKHMQIKANTSLTFSPNIQQEAASEIRLHNETYLEQYIMVKNIEAGVTGIVYSFRNITLRKQLENQLEQQAMFDSLTGLPNRHLLIDQLQKEIAYAKRNNNYIAVFFIDLDSFKAINDTFGHNVGDQLLKTFGQRLKKYVREEDIVARLSGDEFVVTMTSNNIGLEYFNKIIDRFFKYIVQPYNFVEQELIVTASIGISFYPQDGADAVTLIKNADAAMYHAKEKGKNTFRIYNEEMSTQLLMRLQLEHDLHIAIQKKELFLHYQPVIDLNTNQIKSVEVLIRWQHPQLGMVPPSTLIPIAESSGTIFSIGLWVLKTACAQLKFWHDSNLPRIKISVNISECQLKQEDMTKIIKQVLEETQLDAKYLEIEISEKIFLINGNTMVPKLCELKQLGIGITLDEFGTCYSKFAAVKQFPVDCIKINRTLINSFTEHPELGAIIQSIATVAEGLKLHVVAEGIETKEQLAAVNAIFTDAAQGFLFGKPATADETTKLLKNYIEK
ncbi:MAG: EAL domain-containing protein [Gammaproteobacteria bacterium]